VIRNLYIETPDDLLYSDESITIFLVVLYRLHSIIYSVMCHII